MGQLHFLRPEWLWALAPLCLLLAALFRNKQARGSWQAVCDAHLLPYVLEQGAPTKRMKNIFLLGLAGLLAVIALAGPAWQQLPQPVFKQQSALVVILDLSKSMDATDIKPSRLERARLKLLDLLRVRDEGQTALIAYAGDSFVVTPLTDDTDTIGALVHSLSTALMPSQGSRPQRPVRQALDLLAQAGARSGSLLLITDGVSDIDAAALADMVNEAGHRLSVIGVGTLEGAPIPAAAGGFIRDSAGQIVIPRLDESVLKNLAMNTGGVYAAMQIQDADIQQVLQNTAPALADTEAKQTEFKSDRWREEGPWLLLLLLPLATMAFRRGLLVVMLCAGVHWPDPVLALEWGDLWSNANQRGAQAMSREEFGRAAEEFEDTLWKAAASYRNGEYEKALDHLKGLVDTDAAYNRGNALARMGRIEDAIKSYEQALQQQPDHDDARHNLEVLKKLQDQQSQADQRDQSSQSDQQQSSEPGRQEEGDQPQQQEQQQGAGEEQKGSDQAGRQELDQERPSEDSTDPQQGRQQQGEPDQDQAAQQPERNNEQQHSLQAEYGQSEDQSENQSDPPQAEEQQAEQAQREQTQTEARQANEQWLRRVPDDPAGLLRRKFLYQYSRRSRDGEDEIERW